MQLFTRILSHHSSAFMRALCIHSLFLHEQDVQLQHSDSSDSQWLVDHLHMVEHLICILIRWCKKLFGGQKGVQANPLAYMPEYTKAYLSTQPFFLSAFMVRKSLKSLVEDIHKMCSRFILSFFLQTTLSNNNIKWY